ncbi:MAG: hypothetical protein AAFZ74_01925 [Pseudomonadota bacterium]
MTNKTFIEALDALFIRWDEYEAKRDLISSYPGPGEKEAIVKNSSKFCIEVRPLMEAAFKEFDALTPAAEPGELERAMLLVLQNCDATTAPFHLRVKYIAEIARNALDGKISSQPASADAAADLIEQKVKDYHEEHGMYDPSTGCTEYPGEGGEWVHEMQELAEEIRALKPADAILREVQPVGWRDQKELGSNTSADGDRRGANSSKEITSDDAVSEWFARLFDQEEREVIKYAVDDSLFWTGDLYWRDHEDAYAVFCADPFGEADTFIIGGITTREMARCVCAGLRLVRSMPQPPSTEGGGEDAD